MSSRIKQLETRATTSIAYKTHQPAFKYNALFGHYRHGRNKGQIWRGRPRTRPGEVIRGSAYDTRDTRAYLRRSGIRASIPVNIRNRRRPRHGRPYRLDLKNINR
jgi:hypothetical protein